MAAARPRRVVTRTVQKTEPSWTGGRRKGRQKFDTGEELELGPVCHLPIGVPCTLSLDLRFSAPTRGGPPQRDAPSLRKPLC